MEYSEPKKLKHNYTSELELKSLLIRIKNQRALIGTSDSNAKIKKYIKWHTDISSKAYEDTRKRNVLKNKLKNKIVELSESTSVDSSSYERFGEIILLMIKNILKKPQFSGYTFKDDFYSDSVYKILKYLDNFNHKLISSRSGLSVNAFAYISQIIHNSIIFIINTKKKDMENFKKQVQLEALNQNLQLVYDDWYAEPKYRTFETEIEIIERVTLHEIKTSLYEELENLQEDIKKCTRMEITYPESYSITFEEYNKIKPLLNGNVSILRSKHD
jgi:hypothetical protein